MTMRVAHPQPLASSAAAVAVAVAAGHVGCCPTSVHRQGGTPFGMPSSAMLAASLGPHKANEAADVLSVYTQINVKPRQIQQYGTMDN